MREFVKAPLHVFAVRKVDMCHVPLAGPGGLECILVLRIAPHGRCPSITRPARAVPAGQMQQAKISSE